MSALSVPLMLAIAVFASCMRRDTPPQETLSGRVDLALKLSATAEIKTFNYQVTGNGSPPISGSFDIDDATGIRASIVGLAPGLDYLVALSAVSVNGKMVCSGTTTVSVVSGATALANVLLECRSQVGQGAGGDVAGGRGGPGGRGGMGGAASSVPTTVGLGSFDHCPVLRSYVASPSSAAAGGVIKLTATASDADNDPLTITFTQGAVVGTLTMLPVTVTVSASGMATLTCTAGGLTTIAIVATDGRCRATGMIPVTCLGGGGAGGQGGGGGGGGLGGAAGSGGPAASGGVVGSGGIVGSGGAIASGGIVGSGGAIASGGVVGSGGDVGSGGLPGSGGDASGGAIGSGGVGAGGQGTGGDISASGGAVGSGGVVGSGGAVAAGGAMGGGGVTAVGGASGTGGAPACDPTTSPAECVSAACTACTTENCVIDTDGCQIYPTGSADHALCEAAYACFITPANNCTNQGDPLKCWCGTNPTTCLTDNAPPTQANGVCLDKVFAGAKSADAATIRLRFSDPAFPLGGAVNLTVCRGGFCASECGVK